MIWYFRALWLSPKHVLFLDYVPFRLIYGTVDIICTISLQKPSLSIDEKLTDPDTFSKLLVVKHPPLSIPLAFVTILANIKSPPANFYLLFWVNLIGFFPKLVIVDVLAECRSSLFHHTVLASVAIFVREHGCPAVKLSVNEVTLTIEAELVV